MGRPLSQLRVRPSQALVVGFLALAIFHWPLPLVRTALATPSIGFVPPANFGIGGNGNSVIVRDVNGDGAEDALIGAENYPVEVLLGDGSGRFAHYYSSASHGSNQIVCGDLNNDGKYDVVCADQGGGIQILMANGNGTFGAPAAIPPNDFYWSVTLGDFNGDSIPDLAATNATLAVVSTFRGVGNGTFAPPQSVLLNHAPRFITAAYLDSDAHIDLVVTHISDSKLTAYFGDGNGGFPSSIELGTGMLPIFSAAGDVNDDGNADLLVANYSSGTISVFTGNGDRTFASRQDYFVGSLPAGIDLGDFNQDGVVDLAISNRGSHTISIVAGLGGGEFEARRDWSVGSGPAAITVGDFNHDGTDDVLTANYNDHTLTGLLQCGNPVIESVADVSNDQGGRVAVRWQFAIDRYPYDFVTGYRVWRSVGANPHRVASPAPPGADASYFWEPIVELPAARLGTYGYVAPTVHDSVPGSNPLTAFFVQALTSDPNTFYLGEPDSGYSVDNLSPPPPLPFTASYEDSRTVLHWKRSPAQDFATFRLYRGSSAGFVPIPSNLISEGSDTVYVDGPGGYFYKLASVDLHGNSSLFAVVSPGAPTAALVSLASIDVSAERVSLAWYAAGVTTLDARVCRRTMTSGWTEVARISTDGAGALRYEDRDVVAGTRYGYRLVIVDHDIEYASEEVWVTIEEPVLALARIRPNPSSDGEFSVRLVLPAAMGAKLELMDIAGRRLAIKDLRELGAGSHEISIGTNARLRPGIYIVRLTAGADARTMRAVVVR